ncbi:uncharacterized protein LOC144635992 [Oculina patagonica]
MNFLEFAVVIGLLLYLDVAIIQAETSMANVKAIWNRYAQVTKGDSTYYGDYPGGGACALDPPSPLNKQPGWIMVAAGKDDYQKSLGCGMCIEITANGEQTLPSTGGPTPMKGTYKAYVGDLCGGCKQAGFDLYIPGFGKYKTSFKAVECPTVPGTEGNIQFRFTGSNPWSMKLQARNSRVATVGMEILHDDKWICMKRTDDNYFTINGLGEIKYPKKFRVTSISGEQLVTTLPGIKNNENIPSDIQYSGFKPDSNPENIKCFGQSGKAEQPIGPTSAPVPGSPATISSGAPASPPPPTAQPSTEGGTGPIPSTTGGANPPTSKPSTEGDKNFCNGKPTGFYADPKDCSSFYHCANGITYWKHCPEGLYFNPEVKVCDWPKNVKCTAVQDAISCPHGRIIQIAKKSKCL